MKRTRSHEHSPARRGGNVVELGDVLQRFERGNRWRAGTQQRERQEDTGPHSAGSGVLVLEGTAQRFYQARRAAARSRSLSGHRPSRRPTCARCRPAAAPRQIRGPVPRRPSGVMADLDQRLRAAVPASWNSMIDRKCSGPTSKSPLTACQRPALRSSRPGTRRTSTGTAAGSVIRPCGRPGAGRGPRRRRRRGAKHHRSAWRVSGHGARGHARCARRIRGCVRPRRP